MRPGWIGVALAMGLAALQAGAQVGLSTADAPSGPGAYTNNQQLLADRAKTSYAVGASLGQSLRQQGADLDVASLVAGLKGALSGAKLSMSDAEVNRRIAAVQTDLRRRQALARQKMAEEQRKADAARRTAGASYLAANKTKPGVVTLPSGLQYRVLREGTGPKPKPTDIVKVNYRGTFIDGKEFDSSYRRGEPTMLQVSGVIRGWQEALQLMPVGAKWQLAIPSDLAYGLRGAQPLIAPDSTLVFEVELLGIKQ